MPIQKIVSGGQTGVDRAALDVALSLGISHGGWCPKGRLAEDGTIPHVYDLIENDSVDYSKRTQQNVIDSDGTLILFWKKMRGGTRLTFQLTAKHRRPTCIVDLSTHPNSLEVRHWLQTDNISVLNVAGPRASSHQGIGLMAEAFLSDVFDC